MADIVNEIFTSIHLITDKKIKNINLDKTIIATITAHPTASDNLYRVLFQGVEYDVFSSINELYSVNDSVLVLVPDNQFSNKKIILMKEPKIAETLTTATGVNQVSVVSANGFAGTVANSTSTASITLSTTINGILQGNGTAISAATTIGTGSIVLSNSPTMSTASFTGQIISTVTTGVSPLSVSSTTKVINLNADLLDGSSSDYYLNYSNLGNTPSIGNGILTMSTSGFGISGAASFSANTTSNTTFTVASNATSSNVVSTIVARDANGNFNFTTITGSNINITNQIISTLAIGTAPLVVTSTTKVINLNADLLDGSSSDYYLNYNNLTNTPTIGNGALTMSTSGFGISGTASFSANTTSNSTFTVTSNATSSNVASTIMARSAQGSFSATDMTLTGQGLFSAGGLGSPSISFLSDSNTGIYNPSANNLAFIQAGAETMRLDDGLRILIGLTASFTTLTSNTNTDPRLQVAGTSLNSGALGLSRFSNDTTGFRTVFTKSRSASVSGHFIVQSGDEIGALAFSGSDGTQSREAARISVAVDGTPASAIMPGRIAFFTSPTSSATPAERMRLNNIGELLIGYTTTNTTSSSYKLQVNSQIFATSGTIATSDGNYKQNIESLTGSLDIINSLNPVSFNWKPHPTHNFDLNNATVGFIAQEVQEVLKNKSYLNSIIKQNQTIYSNENGQEVIEPFLGIAEGNLIAILTRAMQEQQEQINILKLEVEHIKTMVQ